MRNELSYKCCGGASPVQPGDVHLAGEILHVTLQLDSRGGALDHQLGCAGSCRTGQDRVGGGDGDGGLVRVRLSIGC